MNELDHKIVETMSQYGGGFVKALANAAMVADSDNLRRIKEAWPDLWQRYSAMGEPKAESKPIPVTIVRIILDAEMDVNIDLERFGHALKYVSFSQESDGEYGWIAERSWNNSRAVGYAHPMKSRDYVKTFKTLSGAKRNFLRSHMGPHSFPTVRDERPSPDGADNAAGGQSK